LPSLHEELLEITVSVPVINHVFRVGQKREVKIHKFMVKDTVEVRILKLQENKLKLAEDMLSGAKKRGANKLTLDDLKSLFNVE